MQGRNRVIKDLGFYGLCRWKFLRKLRSGDANASSWAWSLAWKSSAFAYLWWLDTIDQFSKKKEKQYRDRVHVACCAYVWCVCVCVCVLDLEGNWVVASRALAVYLFLTGYNDCLVGFHGPLSPPFRWYTGFKNVLHSHCCLNADLAYAVKQKSVKNPVSGQPNLCSYWHVQGNYSSCAKPLTEIFCSGQDHPASPSQGHVFRVLANKQKTHRVKQKWDHEVLLCAGTILKAMLGKLLRDRTPVGIGTILNWVQPSCVSGSQSMLVARHPVLCHLLPCLCSRQKILCWWEWHQQSCNPAALRYHSR